QFKILDGVLTKNKDIVLIENQDVNKLGSTTKTRDQTTSNSIKVKTYDFDELNKEYKFTVLFGDCEGCLDGFFKEYPHALDNIRLVIFEKDMPQITDYDYVLEVLKKNNFGYV